MKALRTHATNTPAVIEDAPVPDIASDEVLIRVQATALNPLDVHLMSGFAAKFFTITFPYVLGTDIAGIVERVGDAVTQWKPGDAVIAWSDANKAGGMAEFAAVPASSCVRLPVSLSPAEGAGIPTAGSTAWHALFSVAQLKAGETVLIHGGAGGVGSFAIQFAHRAGAHVVATASGDGVDLARSLGADQVIDYQAENFGDVVTDVDVVLDLIGGDTQQRSYDVLRPGGRLVSTVQPPDEAVAKERGVTATIVFVNAFASRLGEVVSAIDTQSVNVVIDRIVPLSQFSEAWERQQSGRARGKVIVSIA